MLQTAGQCMRKTVQRLRHGASYCKRSATCRMSAGAAHTMKCVRRAVKGKYLALRDDKHAAG